MELRNLITFYEIAQLKSFTKAARSLGYAQSTVTAQIQTLEEELESRLFERIGRNIFLTQNGENFLEFAEKILNLANEAKEVVKNTNIIKGTLRIGIVESLCTIKLPEILKHYRNNYPQVEIIVKLASCYDLKKLLKNNSIDLIFILDYQVVDSDFVSSISYKEEMVFLASPENKITLKDKVNLSDVSKETLIFTEVGCSYRMALEEMFRRDGIHPKVSLEIGNIETIKTFTISNLGITLLPLITVKKELANNELKKLNWIGEDFNIITQLIYHKDKWLSPAIVAFIDIAKQVI